MDFYLIVPMTICQIPPTASIWCSVATAQLITALDSLISILWSWKDAATENYAALTTGICTLHPEIFSGFIAWQWFNGSVAQAILSCKPWKH